MPRSAEVPEAVPERSPLLQSRPNRWQDAFWSGHSATRVVRSRRRPILWQEQREFWQEDAPVVARVARESRVEAAQVAPRVQTRTVRELVLEPSRKAGAARRGGASRAAEMARLLQVTRSVDGINAAPHFSLPDGTFSADVSRSLWKGRSVGTPFVTGC